MEPNASNRNPWVEALSSKIMVFIYGVTLGGTLIALWTVPIINRVAKERGEENTAHWVCRGEMVGKDRTIEAQQSTINAQKEQLAVLELAEAETVAYTLLYEPTQPGQASASPLQLLDLVQPGLGSALAKVAPASPQPAGRPHWLIPGYVKPIFNGDPGGASYIWLNTQSGARDVYAPRGTIVQ